MNRAYRIVWNTALGLFQVVSELAKSHSGGSKSEVVTSNGTVIKVKRKPLALAIAAALAMPALFAAQNAAAQVVVNGGTAGTDYTLTGSTLNVTGTVGASGATPAVDNQSGTAIITNSGSIFNGGFFSGAVILNEASATVATLTNTGYVAGEFGVWNDGSIGAVNNNAAGLITGPFDIINNGGTIGAVTNTGTLIGYANVLNAGGSIGTIDNSGTLLAVPTNALTANIVNGISVSGGIIGGTIGSIINSGLLGGNSAPFGSVRMGINNAGIIGGVTNSSSGIIAGSAVNMSTSNVAAYGIDNTGTIGTIANSGTIVGAIAGNVTIGHGLNLYGIRNDESITEIDNAAGGFIGSDFSQVTLSFGGTPTGAPYGIYNDGTIGTITNAGTIGIITPTGLGGSGFAVYNSSSGSIGTLANSGTIAGIIDNEGTITALLDVGSIVSGTTVSIASGTTLTNNPISITNNGEIDTIVGAGLYNARTDVTAITNSGTIIGNVVGISGSNPYANNVFGVAGIYNSGTIATLTNSASGLVAVSSSGAAIANSGSIGTLANVGNIISGGTGIYNGGTVGALNNSGTIFGRWAVYQYAGTILALNNSATGVIAGTDIGVSNYGASTVGGAAIGTITNSGAIYGNDEAIWNANGGVIDVIINNSSTGTIGGTGTVNGQTIVSEYGISNQGSTSTIGTITNAGLINGTNAGINNNNGSIGVIANGGTISGNVGIDNDGSIGVIANGGTIISGSSTGIYNHGSIGLLANSGTIIGGIYSDGTITTVLDVGSVVSDTIVSIASGTTLENGGTLTITNNGEIDTVVSVGLFNALSGVTITNAGTIIGNAISLSGNSASSYVNAGIYNSGDIGVLTNSASGTIYANGSGYGYGIYNDGTIGTLSNAGLIATNAGENSDVAAIRNDNLIGTLSNTGTIGGNWNTGNDLRYAVYNAGTIGVLTNSAVGLITAVTTAVFNNGSIGTLTNAGTITGYGANYSFGLVNDGAITELDNNSTGLIRGVGGGNAVGIQNNDSIDVLNNSGTITTALEGATRNTGIHNNGYIGTLGNTGTIEVVADSIASGGGYSIMGVYNQSAISVLNNNSGGTILGALTNSGGISNAYVYGLENRGIIGTLNNGGLISAADGTFATGEAYVYGLANYSAITEITNSATGTISAAVSAVTGSTTNAAYASVFGLANYSSIGTLSNAGLVEATVSNASFYSGFMTFAGAYSQGIISTFDNTGTIMASAESITDAGIDVYGLDNVSAISPSSALTNSGTILGTLINSASIGANVIGIYTDGFIGTLNNSGTIMGAAASITNASLYIVGIENDSRINELDNTKLIAASATNVTSSSTDVYVYGIYNNSLGTLNNSGTIVASAGSISGSAYVSVAGIYNNNGITQLTNSGTILGTLTNNGTVSGGTVAGIYNQGSIGSLSNTKLIDASATGIAGGTIYVDGIYSDGIIVTLTNSGTITSNGNAGIDNDGSLITLANTGTISRIGTSTASTAAVGAIVNNNFIATLTNSGVIADAVSGFDAIQNTEGFIVTISNSGTITGGVAGIANYGGTIIDIDNVSGGTIGGNYYGIYNGSYIGSIGSIASVSNAGVITGIDNNGGGTIVEIDNLSGGTIVAGASFNYALANSGSIGVINNAGLIEGNILDNSGNGLTINGSSSSIAGILTGSGDTTGTGSIGTINMNGGTLTVASGALLLNDNVTGNLANTGATLEANQLVTISGDYTQGMSGALQLNVSGASTYGALDVLGTATLDNNASIVLKSQGYALASGQVYDVIDTGAGAIDPTSLTYTAGIFGVTGSIVDGDTLELTLGGIATSPAVYNSGTIGTLTVASGVNIVGDLSSGIAATSVDYVGGTIYTGGVAGATFAAGSNQTISSDAEGVDIGIENDSTGVIGALINNGTITANTYGIDNLGKITALTNSATGTILGSETGIYNVGSIGTLTNVGYIGNNGYTGFAGIYNTNGATIGSLGNSGTIYGYYIAIENDGVINTLTNSGQLELWSSVVHNTGSIGVFTNSGTISGYTHVVYNDGGTIGTLTNTSTGLIGGTVDFAPINAGGTNSGAAEWGVENTGYIGVLSNSGTIVGTMGAILNDAAGTIVTLSNSGLLGGTIVDSSSGNTVVSEFGVENAGYIGALTNNAGGNIVGGNSVGVANNFGGTISVLTNNGTITSASTTRGGIWNNGGTIGTLVNAGVIGGTVRSGIWNSGYTSGGTLTGGVIGTITNSGTIAGYGSVIWNSGSIGVLTNSASGVISGGTGIYNDGTIGAINNNGTISGNNGAIYNDGTIGALTNAGAIIVSSSNYDNAISNDGSIGTITNSASGTIVSGISGAISNDGTIGVISNAGTIGKVGAVSSGTYAGGILNYNSIGTIINSGLIGGIGDRAIYNAGTIAEIDNIGTIIGAVSGSGAIENNNSIGVITNNGLIEGDIYSSSDLTINGGTTQGILTGYGDTTGTGSIGNITAPNVTFAAGNLLLNDNVSGNLANAGAVLEVDQPLTISGDYTQAAGATLQIGVVSGEASIDANDTITAGSGYGRLVVMGNATVDNDSTINIVSRGYALATGQRYAVIDDAATGSASYGGVTVAGSITTLTITATNFTSNTAAYVNDAATNDHVLVVTLGTGGGNTITQTNGLPGNGSVLTALTNLPIGITDAGINDIRNALLSELETGGSSMASLSNQLSPSQVTNPDQFIASSEGALKSLVGHLNAGSDDTASGVSTGDGADSKNVWLQGYGGHMNQDARDGFDSYNGNYGGFLFGADKTVENVQLGAAFDYSHSTVKDQDLSGNKLDFDSYGLLGYATYQGKPWYVHAVAGLIWQSVNSDRTVSIAGITNSLNGSFDGQQYLVHLDVGYPFAVGGGVVATPIVGITGVHLHNGAYTESGGGAALSVGNSNANSFRSQLGASVAKSWSTGIGRVTPDASLQWVHEYESSGVQLNASFVEGGAPTAFVVTGQTPIRNYADLGLGATLTKSDTLSFTVHYELQDGNGFTSNTVSLKGVYKF